MLRFFVIGKGTDQVDERTGKAGHGEDGPVV